jgi:integrase
MYDKYVRGLLGRLLLRDIHPVDIQRVFREMLNKDLAKSYANRVRTMLHKMFNEAFKTYLYITFNPVSAVKRFKEDPHMTRYLTQPEAEKLITWANGNQFGIGLETALCTGMRQGEIVGLKWSSVDLERKQIAIQRKWNKKTNAMDEFPKGKKIRIIGIYPEAFLEKLRIQRVKYPASEYVICNSKGEMATPMQLIVALQKGIKETGITNITFHELRHTFASLYMQNRGDLYDLQKVLGHEGISTTERYRHTDPEYLKKKSSVLDLYSVQIPSKEEKPQLELVKNSTLSA